MCDTLSPERSPRHGAWMRTDCLASDDWGQSMGPMNTTNAVNAANAMSATNTPYVQMIDALRWQQQRIIELEAENRELRRQLEDLRRGVGIALVIDGRQISLASSPAAASTSTPSTGPAQDAAWTSGAHPSSAPTTASVPTPRPVPSPITPQYALPTQPPAHAAAHTAPPQRANAQPSEAATFPENVWLTGPAPALKPAQPAQQQPPTRHTSRQEQNRRVEPQQPPQQLQRFTPPAWLHEEAPSAASWESEPEASAPSSHPRVAARRHYTPHNPIPPVPEEIWRAEQQRDMGKFRTLAQITRQQPAVSIPGKPRKTNNTHDTDHSPFADSFVLG